MQERIKIQIINISIPSLTEGSQMRKQVKYCFVDKSIDVQIGSDLCMCTE